MLTASNGKECLDALEAHNMGANDFFTKPIILEKRANCVSNRLDINDLANS